MRLVFGGAFVLWALLAGACSNPNIFNAAQEKDGALVASFDAKKRAIILLKTGSNAYVCPEPPPDVATEVATEFNAALKLTAEKISADASVANKIAETFRQISPTSEATTLLRSSLSQFCWLSINQKLNQTQTQEGFNVILATARGLAYREVAQGLVEQLKSLGTDPASAETRKQVLDALKVILLQASANPQAVSEALIRLQP